MPKLKSSSSHKSKRKESKSVKIHVGSDNVFRDIGFTKQEAEYLLIKSTLMITLEQIIKKRGWTQAEAAQKLGLVQPRVSELKSGRMDRFSIDTLIKYLIMLGKKVEVIIQ